MGYALWTRAGGDFSWHGPAAAFEVAFGGRLVLEARLGVSVVDASAGVADLEARVWDAHAGVALWREILLTRRQAALVGAGVALHRLAADGRVGDDETTVGTRLVPVPGVGLLCRLRLSDPLSVEAVARAGFATRSAKYVVGDEPVAAEGAAALEAGARMRISID